MNKATGFTFGEMGEKVLTLYGLEKNRVYFIDRLVVLEVFEFLKEHTHIEFVDVRGDDTEMTYTYLTVLEQGDQECQPEPECAYAEKVSQSAAYTCENAIRP